MGEKYFGKERTNGIGLPLPGSEDFAYYLEKIPGAFLGLGTKDPKVQVPNFPHTSNFDFNDTLIASGSYFWVRLAEDRFNCQIL